MGSGLLLRRLPVISHEALKDLFVTNLGLSPAYVDMNSTFDEDFDMSGEESESLRLLVESELGLSIPADDWDHLNTMEDILEYEKEQSG
jgi:acyl carrier protein